MDEPAEMLAEFVVDDFAGAQVGKDRFIGRLIHDKYEVLQKLGEGGMGLVYKARHRQLKRDYAVKFLLSSNPHGFDVSEIARFEREAQQASGLHHQNLVSVIDFGTTNDGIPFLVMDLMQGKTVSQMLLDGKGPLPTEDALEIARQLCEGLQYAHDRGVIHRDLKPSNIMVSQTDDRIRVHVLDFGVAKFNTPEADAALKTLTSTGQIVGSPAYMSPEQAMGYKLDGRSDIYALGCVLFEMLTGRAVFQGDSPLAIVVQHMNALAPDIRSIPQGRHVPPEIAGIIRQTLEKEPGNRYKSMADLEHDLLRVMQGQKPDREFATGRLRRQAVFLKTSKLAIAAAVIFGTFATAGFGYLLMTSSAPEWKRGFDQAQFEKGERSLTLYRLAVRKAQTMGVALPQILHEQDLLMRTYNDRDDADDALAVGQDAVSYASEKGDMPELAQVYDQMAEAEIIAKDFPKAIDYAKRAAEMKERLHMEPLYVAHSLGRLARACRQNKDYTLAESTNLYALGVLQKNHVASPFIADIYLQLSNLYSDQQQWEKAVENIKSALDASTKTRGANDIETIRLGERLRFLENQSRLKR